MSTQLQVAIPLFVTFVALAGIAIWRKYLKAETFVIGLAVLAMAVTMTFGHLTAAGVEKKDAAATTVADTSDFSLALAKRYLLDGRYDAAQDILDRISQQKGNDPNIRLTAARRSLLTGDYATALQLYKQLSGVQQELELTVRLLDSTQPNDNAFITYLQHQGKDPGSYGLVAGTTSSQVDYDAAKDLILGALEQELEDFRKEEGKDVSNALDHTAELDLAFEKYLDTGSDLDRAVVEELLKDLSTDVKKEPDLDTNVDLRLSRLEGYVLVGDFEQIAKKADEHATTEELVVLAQLMTSGVIDKKDFSDDFATKDTERYEAVLDASKDTLKLLEQTMSGAELDAYEDKVDVLKDLVKDPVRATLQMRLLEEAMNGDPAMQSKCYLALAKLENFVGNAEQAEAYITAALGTAASSDDLNYQIPMIDLTQIIQGTTDTDEIMNVAEYVDAALDHSLPLDIQVSEMVPSTEGGVSLNDQMTETVNTSTATINIGVIDKDAFPVVKARIQIQSQKWLTDEELKAHMKVYDCGSLITNFQLEHLEYQSSRIILLCDCSGSMSGSEETLRQCIRDFAASMSEGEEVCVVGFNGDIDFITDFSGDKDTVSGYADRIFASGGTALFNSLIEVGDLMTQDVNCNNIIIAMTDGQDGYTPGEGTMYEQISSMAAEKGLTVYTIGMGDVDAGYLEKMAKFGNGSFLYARDQEDLQAFYTFIHGQMKNQYILTYTAKNQTRNERTLEISVDEELGSARKTYYLTDPTYTDEGSDSYDPYVVEDTDVTVDGLSTKFLYKSSQAQTLDLKGSGFDAGDDMTVRMIGNVKYDLTATFVDANTYRVTIPAAVATGVYDLEISIADSSASLKKELTVATPGSMKSFNYGSYRFTALESHVDDQGQTILSGNVTMNGWLRFKGDLTVTYDYYESGKAWITDESGFYISYAPDMSTGLANYLAQKGIPLSFGAMGTFYITDDPYSPESYDSFDADRNDYYGELNMLMFNCENFNLTLYPDTLKIQGFSFNSKLPFQDQLMRDAKLEDLRSVDLDTHCLLGATQIGLTGKMTYKNDSEGFKEDFVMVSLPMRIDELEIKVDTLKNDYSVEAEVGLKMPNSSVDGFGFSLGIVGGRFDSIGLQIMGPEVRLVDAPVPVSMGDFGFEIAGMSKYESDSTLLQKLLDTEITIEFEVSVANLDAYVPQIRKLMDSKDDVAMAQLKDCKLKLKLRDFRISFDAKMVLVSKVELGEVSVTMGKFSYTNALIGYYDKTEYGLRVALKKDFLKLDTANMDVGVTGQAEVCLGYPYTGLWVNGNADFEIGWGIFKADWDVSGDFLIGAYENSLGNFQFSIILRGQGNSGGYAGFHAYVTKTSGFDVYTY